MKRRWPRSRLFDGVKSHDHLRIAPAAPERLDPWIRIVRPAAEAGLADRAHAQAGVLERGLMLVDRMRVKRHCVLGAVEGAKRAAPAALCPRWMEVGVDEVAAGCQHARHF